MRLSHFVAAAAFVVSACGQQPPTAESCEPLCAQAMKQTKPLPVPAPAQATPTLSSFEKQLIEPLLEDVRAGVRPFDAESIGVCEGEKECDRFVGESVEELAPGSYIVQALLRVPAMGEAGTWQVEFATECTTTMKTDKGESTSTNRNSRTYDVEYVGTERPYRLMPLRKLTSPMKGGTQTCEYTLTAAHPDGDKVYTGGWTIPEEEEEER